MSGYLVLKRPAAKGKPPRWELRAYAGVDPAIEPGTEAHYERKTRSFVGTKKQANAALRIFVDDVEAGRLRATRQSFAFLLERWYAHASPDWSPKHCERVRGVIDAWLVPNLGDIGLDRLGPEDLDRLYTKMRREGLADATRRKVHNTASRALNQAVRWGWIPANPAQRATAPSDATPEIVPPTDAQVAELLAGVRSPDLLAFLVIAAATGARRGEICALRRSDVDLGDEPTLRIGRAISQVGQVVAVVEPKTPAGFRRISLDAGTAAAIAAHLDRIAAHAAKAEVQLDPNPYLFGDDPACAEPWRPARVTRAFARLRVATGVQAVRLHDLRHAHATILLSALGIDAVTVARRLGHSNANVTHKIYAHFMPAADRAAADLWGQRTTTAAPPEGSAAV